MTLFEGYNPSVPLGDLRVWPGNPRKTIDPAKLNELAESIRAIGLQQPLVVRPSGEVVAGQRRYLACKMGGFERVPCVVRDLDDTEALEVAIAENAARTDVSPIEEAEAIESYLDAGRLAQQAADRFGRTVAWVEGRRRLLALTPTWRSRVAADECPIRHAELVARLKPETQDALSTRFANRELPAFLEFERVVLTELHRLAEAPFGVQDETYPGGSCQGCPSRSDRQVALFGGSDPEDAACLDPGCWAGKVAHRWELAQKDAKKRKLRVLSTEEAGLYVSGSTASASQWVETERASGHGLGLASTAISRTDDGHIVELVTREAYVGSIEARKAKLKAEIEAKATERGAEPKAQKSEAKSEDATRETDQELLLAALPAIAAQLPRSVDVLREIAAECESWADAAVNKAVRDSVGYPTSSPWIEAQASDCLAAICLYAVSSMAGNIAKLIAAAAKRDAEREDAEGQRARELHAGDVGVDIARMIARFEGEIDAARSARDLGNAWRAIESEDHRASLPALAKLWLAKAETMGVSAATLKKMRKAGEAPVVEVA